MEVLKSVELVMWSPATKAEPPTVVDVRSRLAQYGFNAERAADIPVATAFRRTVKLLETKEPLTKVTVFSDKAKPPKLHAQVDALIVDEDRLTRNRLAHYQLDPADGTVSPYIDLQPALDNYTWADVSTVLQSIFREDGSGAYTPKKTGGVYFVPVLSKDFLDRLEAACRGFNLNLLRYTIPDTDSQRAEIQDAIAVAFTAEISTHTMAVEGYSAETRPGVLENCRERIRGTHDALIRVRPLCSDAWAGLIESMRTLLTRIAAIELQQTTNAELARMAAEESAEASKYAAQGLGGRRIVTNSD